MKHLMIPLELSVSDATIWSLTLESSFTILEVLFDDCKMFIAQATGLFIAFELNSMALLIMVIWLQF
jgi:hypothetical protein